MAFLSETLATILLDLKASRLSRVYPLASDNSIFLQCVDKISYRQYGTTKGRGRIICLVYVSMLGVCLSWLKHRYTRSLHSIALRGVGFSSISTALQMYMDARSRRKLIWWQNNHVTAQNDVIKTRGSPCGNSHHNHHTRRNCTFLCRTRDKSFESVPRISFHTVYV